MQKADALQLMKSDLEDTVSVMRKEQYERVLLRATTIAEIRTLDFQVRADAKLRTDHKNQVLLKIERSLMKAELAPTGGCAEKAGGPVSLGARAIPSEPGR